MKKLSITKIRPYTDNVDLEIYKEVRKEYDILADTLPPNKVPRLIQDQKIFYKDIVYYINLLYENNPKSVADIGAGINLWSKWFDNIIAFEPKPTQWAKNIDSIEQYDEDFVKKYIGAFDCAMAINSLHFIHYDKLKERIEEAMLLVNDRFLFTFNLKVIAEEADEEYDYIEHMKKIMDIVKSVNYNIVMLDYLIDTDDNVFGYMNGNIRVIYET